VIVAVMSGVVLPHFGYDPDFVSATIDQLLNDG
jgi:hypothetical protein